MHCEVAETYSDTWQSLLGSHEWLGITCDVCLTHMYESGCQTCQKMTEPSGERLEKATSTVSTRWDVGINRSLIKAQSGFCFLLFKQFILSGLSSVVSKKLYAKEKKFYKYTRQSCKTVRLKSRAQLVHGCVIDVEKYENNVQDSKQSSLQNNSSFREHDYLITLSDLNCVRWRKFYVKKIYFLRLRAGLEFHLLSAREGLPSVDCQKLLTCERVTRAREAPDMRCRPGGCAPCLGRAGSCSSFSIRGHKTVRPSRTRFFLLLSWWAVQRVPIGATYNNRHFLRTQSSDRLRSIW